ncbi:renalase isoform X2 [Oryzias melastigma]|uniref:renalase isoform X2 n=1 Tax=Oryzias melastigma TaxID=30732 RepID=UPI000CF82919|nr:renalase isoform X2 [Oryzias melastigma]
MKFNLIIISGGHRNFSELENSSEVKHFYNQHFILKGGRMSTSRPPPEASSHSADLGAQYITATPAYAQSHHSFYTELLSAGVLQPLDCPIEGLRQRDGSTDYVTPRGTGSLVKHFLSQSGSHAPFPPATSLLVWIEFHLLVSLSSGADVFLEHHVTALYRRGASWEVERKSGGSETFDAVVLTMPVPQILQLQGDLGNLLSVQQKQQLDAVRFSSRFALALFFPPGAVFSFSWAAKYVSDSSCIRYIAVDDRKRGADTSACGPALVVHTSVPFGEEHLEQDKEDVQPIILQELHRLLPDLPQPVSIKCQKWRYSQVLTSVPDCPGHMTVLEQPPLVCGGDAFCHSNFDGCVESALSVLGALKASLANQPGS